MTRDFELGITLCCNKLNVWTGLISLHGLTTLVWTLTSVLIYGHCCIYFHAVYFVKSKVNSNKKYNVSTICNHFTLTLSRDVSLSQCHKATSPKSHQTLSSPSFPFLLIFPTFPSIAPRKSGSGLHRDPTMHFTHFRFSKRFSWSKNDYDLLICQVKKNPLSSLTRFPNFFQQASWLLPLVNGKNASEVVFSACVMNGLYIEWGLMYRVAHKIVERVWWIINWIIGFVIAVKTDDAEHVLYSALEYDLYSLQ